MIPSLYPNLIMTPLPPRSILLIMPCDAYHPQTVHLTTKGSPAIHARKKIFRAVVSNAWYATIMTSAPPAVVRALPPPFQQRIYIVNLGFHRNYTGILLVKHGLPHTLSRKPQPNTSNKKIYLIPGKNGNLTMTTNPSRFVLGV